MMKKIAFLISFKSTDYLMKAARTNPQYAYCIAPNIKFIFRSQFLNVVIDSNIVLTAITNCSQSPLKEMRH